MVLSVHLPNSFLSFLFFVLSESFSGNAESDSVNPNVMKLLHIVLLFDYGYKDTAAFSYFQIFFNFFYTFFSVPVIIPIYAGFLVFLPFPVVCSVGAVSGGVPVVCPVFLNHTRIHTRIRTRTGIFRL